MSDKEVVDGVRLRFECEHCGCDGSLEESSMVDFSLYNWGCECSEPMVRCVVVPIRCAGAEPAEPAEKDAYTSPTDCIGPCRMTVERALAATPSTWLAEQRAEWAGEVILDIAALARDHDTDTDKDEGRAAALDSFAAELERLVRAEQPKEDE